MIPTVPHAAVPWPGWQRIGFRFFFIYFMLQTACWTWIDAIPGGSYLTQFYYKAGNWVVELVNRNVLHIKEVLVLPNGSGDTSYGWAELYTFLLVSIVGTCIWTVADRKRTQYAQLSYWLRLIMRYSLVITCFVYGFIKIFPLQMTFPNQSQLATPLGDLLPMRFSWLFIGYSAPYQAFSGAMEVIAGMLLLYRKTITGGLILATAVFVNVMMLNLSYDIPVKIYSMNIVLMCLYLLANDYRRLTAFLVFNQPTSPNRSNDLYLPKKWMRITRIVLKLVFLILYAGFPFYNAMDRHQQNLSLKNKGPIPAGVYDVVSFAVNKDSLPNLVQDTLRWKDMVFEKDGSGSVGTSDTTFRQRYRRGYFNFEKDSTKNNLILKKFGTPIFTFRYEMPDSSTIRLWGLKAKDSLYVELKKSKRRFQLAEKQFHWLSEANR